TASGTAGEAMAAPPARAVTESIRVLRRGCNVVGTPGDGANKIATAGPRGQLPAGRAPRRPPMCSGPTPPPRPGPPGAGWGTPATLRCWGAGTRAPGRAGSGEGRAARAPAPRPDPGR